MERCEERTQTVCLRGSPLPSPPPQPMSSKKGGDDSAQKPPTKAASAAPMLISLDFSALIKAIEDQNNRIEELEMQLRRKDDEVAALTQSVTVSWGGDWGGGGGGGVIGVGRGGVIGVQPPIADACALSCWLLLRRKRSGECAASN